MNRDAMQVNLPVALIGTDTSNAPPSAPTHPKNKQKETNKSQEYVFHAASFHHIYNTLSLIFNLITHKVKIAGIAKK
jgi:hypothetical protein